MGMGDGSISMHIPNALPDDSCDDLGLSLSTEISKPAFLTQSPKPLTVLFPQLSQSQEEASSNPTLEALTTFSASTSEHLNVTLTDQCFEPLIGYSSAQTEAKGRAEEKQIVTQKHAAINLKIEEDNLNPMPQNSAAELKPCQSSRRASDQNVKNRLRRAKISEELKALKECVPSSIKGSQESELDVIIDYITLLKFKVKSLSQSRLRGEATQSLIYVEGLGRYLPNHIPSEPLEEVLEQLMESNMPSALQFFQQNGLAVLPMALADSLFQVN